MKTVKYLVFSILLAAPAISSALEVNESVGFTSDAMIGNSVEAHLPNIRDRIKNCTVLPYTYNKKGEKVIHPLLSHCPEIKVLPPVNGNLRAKIKVGGHHFVATLIETDHSDGDFYDVEIRDAISNDSFYLTNVLAYGDVLVGILNGDTSGIPTQYVTWLKPRK